MSSMKMTHAPLTIRPSPSRSCKAWLQSLSNLGKIYLSVWDRDKSEGEEDGTGIRVRGREMGQG